MNVKKIIKILNDAYEKIVAYKTLYNADFNFDAYTTITPGHKINHYAVMVDDYSVELYSQSEKGTFLSVLLLLPIYSLFIDWQGLQPFLLKYLFPVSKRNDKPKVCLIRKIAYAKSLENT